MLGQVGVIHHQEISGINRWVLIEVDPVIHDRDLLSPLICPDIRRGNVGTPPFHKSSRDVQRLGFLVHLSGQSFVS